MMLKLPNASWTLHTRFVDCPSIFKTLLHCCATFRNLQPDKCSVYRVVRPLNNLPHCELLWKRTDFGSKSNGHVARDPAYVNSKPFSE